MNPEAIEVRSRTVRPRPGSRRGLLRRSEQKARRRRFALEGLEPRTLMATLPAARFLSLANLVSDISAPVQVSSSGGDESSPSVAINAANPQILASSWVRNDQTRTTGQGRVLVEAAVSFNGGANWTPLNTPGPRGNPTVTDGTAFPLVTNGGVAFDRSGNVYVLQVQSTNNFNAGVVLLFQFNVTTGSVPDHAGLLMEPDRHGPGSGPGGPPAGPGRRRHRRPGHGRRPARLPATSTSPGSTTRPRPTRPGASPTASPSSWSRRRTRARRSAPRWSSTRVATAATSGTPRRGSWSARAGPTAPARPPAR